jgi:uncharacterized damage-inducible protein DinB
MSWLADFQTNACLRLTENTEKMAGCLALIRESEFWHQPNPHTLSIGTTLVHLRGNITQYIPSSLGHQPDLRVRDQEFATRGGATQAEVWGAFQQTIDQAQHVIKQLSESEALRVRPVQAYHLSGIGIVLHVVEHYSYHTGQVAYITKLLHGRELNFYAGVDLNQKNQNE